MASIGEAGPSLEEILSRYDLKPTDLDKECPKRVRDEVAVKLGDWEMVGCCLEFTLEKLRDINRENSTQELCRITLLDAWRKRDGEKATYLKLASVLHRRQRCDLVEFLCGKFKSTLSLVPPSGSVTNWETPSGRDQQHQIQQHQGGSSSLDEIIKAKPPNNSSNGVGREERVHADSTEETETPLYDESEAKIDIDPVPRGSRFEQLQSFAKDVKLVLHTVNDKEITAVLGKLQPPDIDGFEKPISFDAIPFKIVFGTFGGYRVAQVNTEMGTECEKDLKEALTRLPNAYAVIAVGVAYGSDREKYKFGDVLVSKYMHSVKNIKLQPNEIIARPNILSTVPVADYLSSIFTKGTNTWNKEFQCNKTTDSDREPRYAKVHCGSIISAPMLVADAKSRDKLLRNYPGGAIGGEMEGGVLLEIQNKHNADRARHHDLGVIIIKGVGDFGDDQKQEGKKWQYTASLAAASYIEHKLNMTGGRLFTETEPKNPED